VARRGTYAPSAVVWHGGVRGALDTGVAHHNVHFGSAWRSSFDALMDNRVMADPSMLVSVPTRSEPALAPADRHVIYALEPVPNLRGQLDWTRARPRFRQRVVDRLAALGYPVEVEVEELYDPLDWERAGLQLGTPFSLAHRLVQTGPLRTPNVDGRVPGLVFTGAGTVPGVGVPMVLLSGRLAAERVRGATR
jgi:phytoene desaturase